MSKANDLEGHQDMGGKHGRQAGMPKPEARSGTQQGIVKDEKGQAGGTMSKETPKDDHRQRTDQGSHAQTDKPWRGNPEKEQRNDDPKIDLEKWHESNTH